MTERLVGVTLPTHDDYTPWQVALGECYPDVMVGDLSGAEGIWDGGALPFIHLMFKEPTAPDATIQNIAAGMFDPQIEDWFMELLRYCATGRKAVVVYLPEMNGNWTVYGTDDWDPEAFVEAWDTFVTMGKTMGLDETMVKWCWAPNDTGWGTLSDWYPGGNDQAPDVIGGSVYNWGGIFPNEPWESPATLFDRYVLEVREFTTKPIVITQTGSGLNDTRTPQWLDDAVFYTNNYSNIEGFIWYNEGPFQYGPGRDEFNDKVGVLESARPDHWFRDEEEIAMGSRASDNALDELQEAFPDVRAGVWNCRPIAGTSIWSQHSWGNALDLHHVGWPYEQSDRNYAFLDPIHRWLKTYQEELSIRTLLWRVKDHHDHIHLDFWPKGYGQPPCDGGSLRMQYNDGRVVNGDPGPANGLIELPDKELIAMSDAQVLEKGMSGVAVADLQKMLVDLGWDLGVWTPFGPGYPPGADGKFGQGTVDAVTAYQDQRELVVTGKADGVTLFYIREDLGYAGQSELVPHDHGFIVNIPAVTITSTTEETP